MRSFVLLAAILASGACRHGADAADPRVDVTWTLGSQVVGPSALVVTLRDSAGAPVNGAVVRLEGHMTHPGMAPIQATATSRTGGVYHVDFAFTMPGDWALLVSAVLPDGRRIERRIDVANVRAAS